MNPEDWQAWQVWLALAIGLGVLELFSLDLILLMLAVGAVVGLLTSLLPVPVWLTVLAAVGTSFGMLVLVRPSVVKRMQQSGPNLVLGHEALVGKQGVVVSEVSSDGGQIRVSGEIWTARPYDDDLVIEPGARVDILQIKGATALVHKIPELGA
jgi:membrane protein implicated in regulation of membrane protease activity